MAAESISNYELGSIVSNITDCEIIFEGEDHSPSFNYNNRYTIDRLGYIPLTNFLTGITEMIAWIKR